MTLTPDEQVIAGKWHEQILSILAFQFAGIFILLFYYSDLVISFHNWLAPSYELYETVDTSLRWVHGLTDSLQRLLSSQYYLFVLASLCAVSAIFALITITALRRLDFGVLLRATFFTVIGLVAIPAVLWGYVFRWVPREIFSFFAEIISVIVSAFSFIAPYVGSAIIGIVALSILVSTIVWFARSTIGHIALALAVVVGGSLLFVPTLLHALSSVVLGAWSVAGVIVAYPIAILGYVFGIIGSIFAFTLGALVVMVLSMFVFSQFGHMFIDTLFDARNVRRSARAAGRFLVGIGFLVSTILLCLPGNQLAQQGATVAYVKASELFGGNGDSAAGASFVANIGLAYLWVIPDAVEPAIVQAFSYGYPPSLDLILVTIACLIAFYLIAQQLLANDRRERLTLAFLPSEIFFLLIGAALVVLFALTAAGDAEG